MTRYFNQWIVFMQTYAWNRLKNWQIMDAEVGGAQYDEEKWKTCWKKIIWKSWKVGTILDP